jgi:hypothetical protein
MKLLDLLEKTKKGKFGRAQTYSLYMPNGGEDGVLIGWRADWPEGKWVEFRGPPYSQWKGEGSDFELVHDALEGRHATVLHTNDVLDVLPTHPRYDLIKHAIDNDAMPPVTRGYAFENCQFITSCVNCQDVPALEEMIDNGQEITYEEFISHVGEEEVAEFFPDYDWHGGGGLTLEKDWAVTYEKSTYQGRPVVFMNHSAIEYVWACDSVSLSEADPETLKLPDLTTGDELMVGKFKNRNATIKGFTKDKHNQPIAKTDKGDQQIFKGRVKKLMNQAVAEARGIAPDMASKIIRKKDLPKYQAWKESGEKHMPHGMGVYRVTGWYCPRTPPVKGDDNMHQILSNLLWDAGDDFDKVRPCQRKDATHVTGSGVAGIFEPIENVAVIGRVDWTPERVQQEKNDWNKHVMMGEAIRIGEPQTGLLYRWVEPRKVVSNMKTDSMYPGKWKHNIPGVGAVSGISLGYDPHRWNHEDATVQFVLNRSKLNAKKIIDIPGQEVYNHSAATLRGPLDKTADAGFTDDYEKAILDPKTEPDEAFYVGIIRPLSAALEMIQVKSYASPRLKQAVQEYAAMHDIKVESDFVESLSESTASSFLYHGTSTSLLPSIKKTGLNAPSYWTPDPEMAEYFANYMASMRDGNPIILRFSMGNFDPSLFDIDRAMLRTPVDPLADYWGWGDELSTDWDQLIVDKWTQENGETGEDSLRVLRSAIYREPIPARAFSNVVTEEVVPFTKQWAPSDGQLSKIWQVVQALIKKGMGDELSGLFDNFKFAIEQYNDMAAERSIPSELAELSDRHLRQIFEYGKSVDWAPLSRAGFKARQRMIAQSWGKEVTESSLEAMMQTAEEKAIADLVEQLLSGIDETVAPEIFKLEVFGDPHLTRDELPDDYEQQYTNWVQGFAEESVERAAHNIESGMEYDANGIVVHRVIKAPEDWAENIKAQGLGEYWSWDKGSAEAHWAGKGNVTWHIIGRIDPWSVNWEQTLFQNAHPSHDEEREIYIPSGTPVELLGLEANGQLVDPQRYGGKQMLTASIKG